MAGPRVPARLETGELGCREPGGWRSGDSVYRELGRGGAEMVVQVVAEREERSRIASVAGEALTGGGGSRTFTGPRLCAASVDRLTFRATVRETGTEPCRPARTETDKAESARPHRDGQGQRAATAAQLKQPPCSCK
jgi:hypothetical protein